MKEEDLYKKEETINLIYEKFLNDVSDAFNHHCDEIKRKAEEKLETIPEENEEDRQSVLDEEKEQLDRTLSELKQLLAKKSAEVRTQLEEIGNLRDQSDFDLEDQLADLEGDNRDHAA